MDEASALRAEHDGQTFYGFVNHGGTLDWPHVVSAIADALGRPPGDLLRAEDLSAIRGEADPCTF